MGFAITGKAMKDIKKGTVVIRDNFKIYPMNKRHVFSITDYIGYLPNDVKKGDRVTLHLDNE